jgi:hypothetical protein
MAKKRRPITKSKKQVKQVIPKKFFDKLAGKGKHFSKNQKERIGRELVSRMKSRSLEGDDIEEEKFASYGSGSNREGNGRFEALRRKEKKLGRKISPKDVDMKISEKLLKSIKVKVTEDGDLEVFHKGEKNNLKALGHIGNSRQRPRGVPQREYFGSTDDDVLDVTSKFRAKDGEES